MDVSTLELRIWTAQIANGCQMLFPLEQYRFERSETF